MRASRRSSALIAICAIVVLAVAIPVLAADPSTPPGQSKPDKSPNPGQQKKAEKAAKEAKTPEIAITVTGTVQQATDGKGRPTFTLTADGKTWGLSAGPSGYWGDKNPLAAYVGKSVTVAGSHHEGETEIDVETVNGTAIRAAGKPPWAGGPWVVGSTHPGWKPWMADGKPGKGHGQAGAPGQNKDKTPDATESEKPGS
jgi:hypothetical protein